MTLRFIGNKFIFALKLYNITLWSLLFKILLISSITLKNNFFFLNILLQIQETIFFFGGGGFEIASKITLSVF